MAEIVSFDADACLAAVRDAVDGPLYTFVEYDANDWNLLYMDEATLSFYSDREQMAAHFDQIHSHVSLDFQEIDLFAEDLFPAADHVRAKTTHMDFMTIIRVYYDREGLFLAVDPDEQPLPLIDAIDDAAGRG